MTSILDLPLELLDELAVDESSYRALLSIPKFARSITPNRRIDFMIKFKHTVEIGFEPSYSFRYLLEIDDYDHLMDEDATLDRTFIIWKRNGKIHRLDGPALTNGAGYELWFRDDKIHRDNYPAFKSSDGELWYKHGKLHREDGPAVIDNVLHCRWYYRNGDPHREDGPACIDKRNNRRGYWKNGEYSRKDWRNKLSKLLRPFRRKKKSIYDYH